MADPINALGGTAPDGDGAAQFRPAVQRFLVRIREVLLEPVGVWERIRAEAASIAEPLGRYLLPLALVVELARVIVMRTAGVPLGSPPIWKPVSLGAAATFGILNLLLFIGLLYLSALIVTKLTHHFGGIPAFEQSIVLLAYASTPYLIGQLVAAFPLFGGTGALIGLLYSLFLFYQGVPAMLSIPLERSAAFSAASFLSFVVTAFLFFGLLGALLPGLASL